MTHQNTKTKPGYQWKSDDIEVKGEGVGPRAPGYVPKRWGFEQIFHNEPNYCMKRLHLRANESCSMHFHIDKHETMLVAKGVLQISFIWDKIEKQVTLNEWEAFTIPPGFPHRLTALSEEGCDVIEASTMDDPQDSIRIG